MSKQMEINEVPSQKDADECCNYMKSWRRRVRKNDTWTACASVETEQNALAMTLRRDYQGWQIRVGAAEIDVGELLRVNSVWQECCTTILNYPILYFSIYLISPRIEITTRWIFYIFTFVANWLFFIPFLLCYFFLRFSKIKLIFKRLFAENV